MWTEKVEEAITQKQNIYVKCLASPTPVMKKNIGKSETKQK